MRPNVSTRWASSGVPNRLSTFAVRQARMELGEFQFRSRLSAVVIQRPSLVEPVLPVPLQV